MILFSLGGKKPMKKTTKLKITVIVGITFLLLTGVAIRRLSPIQITCHNSENCLRMSSLGGVVFEFSKPVKPDMVERLLHTDPVAIGQWEWLDTSRARWINDDPLPVGSQVTIRLDPGDAGDRGVRIKKTYTWELSVRPALILALGQSDFGTEIFLIDTENGGVPGQLTNTGGQIYDYAPSPDGEEIVYSVHNDSGGLDLWIFRRDGSDPHVLIECGANRCTTPDWSRTAYQLTYTRENRADSDTDIQGRNEIWVMDLMSKQAARLFAENYEAGSDSKWSPDGQWISFWNRQKSQIQLVNLENENVISLDTPNGNAGCWSPDGRVYYYSGMLGGEGNFLNLILSVHTEKSTVSEILGGDDGEGGLSVDNPICNPVDQWLAVRIQPNINIPGYEFIAVKPDTKEMVSIMKDYSRIISGYSWSPDGSQIVLQTFPLGGDLSDFQIWIWDQADKEVRVLSTGFRIPKWLP